MRQNTLSALILGSAVAVLLSAVPASAQATRTFISGVGNDADPCSRTAPCRTFAGAIVKTFINGEINCLDPGGYGTVNITKSITIDCKHTLGSDLSSGTTGIIVNIPVSVNDPTRSVRLRGILINGTGASGAVGTRTGIDGIRILQANSVFVEDSRDCRFLATGHRGGGNRNVNLVLDDVMIRNTNVAGVTLATTAGQVVASFNNVRIDGTPLGLSAANRVRASIRNVMLGHNADRDSDQWGGQHPQCRRHDGLIRDHRCPRQRRLTVRISNSVITQNSTGLNANGGSIMVDAQGIEPWTSPV